MKDFLVQDLETAKSVLTKYYELSLREVIEKYSPENKNLENAIIQLSGVKNAIISIEETITEKTR